MPITDCPSGSGSEAPSWTAVVHLMKASLQCQGVGSSMIEAQRQWYLFKSGWFATVTTSVSLHAFHSLFSGRDHGFNRCGWDRPDNKLQCILYMSKYIYCIFYTHLFSSQSTLPNRKLLQSVSLKDSSIFWPLLCSSLQHPNQIVSETHPDHLLNLTCPKRLSFAICLCNWSFHYNWFHVVSLSFNLLMIFPLIFLPSHIQSCYPHTALICLYTLHILHNIPFSKLQEISLGPYAQ